MLPTLRHPEKKDDLLQLGVSPAAWRLTSFLHDLRNPVATVCVGAGLLAGLSEVSPSEVKRLATNINHAACEIRNLLDEFLGQQPANTLQPEITGLRDVIAAAAESASVSVPNERVQIVLNVSADIKLPLMRSRMESVFRNLIVNSLQAIRQDGQIRIAAKRNGKSVIIHLEDTGPGIPAGIRNRLFEPFVTAEKKNGLGIGLAIARAIVLWHGGEIWIEPASGAHFAIRLPLGQNRRLMHVPSAHLKAG